MSGITLVSAGTWTDAFSSPFTASFGQPVTAGNLLVAFVVTTGGPASTASTGWALAGTSGPAGQWTGIFYRANCGAAEAAPSFTCTGNDNWCQLMEFSGAATSSVAEQAAGDQGAGYFGQSGWVALLNAADTLGGELVCATGAWLGAPAGLAETISVPEFRDNSGAYMAGTLTPANNAFGKSVSSLWAVAGVPGSHPHLVRECGSIDAVTGNGVIATFKPAAGSTASLAITTSSLVSRYDGIPYIPKALPLGRAVTVDVTGGTPPYTWSVTAGSLPAGLTLGASTGAITGTPTSGTSVGTSSFTVQVTDSASGTVSAALSITIMASPAVIFTDGPNPSGVHFVSSVSDPETTGLGDDSLAGANVGNWHGAGPGTLSVQNGHQYYFNCNFNTGSGAVEAYISSWADHAGSYQLVPAVNWRNLTALVTSWDTYIPANPTTIISACYDIWFDQNYIGATTSLGIPGGTDLCAELMFHVTCVNRGSGPYIPGTTNLAFGGYSVGGYDIPLMYWNCAYSSATWPGGNAMFWQLGGPVTGQQGVFSTLSSGIFDVIPVMHWMQDNNILPHNAKLLAFSMGWEICNTAGASETFYMNDASWHAITDTPAPLAPSIVNRAVTVPMRIGRGR